MTEFKEKLLTHFRTSCRGLNRLRQILNESPVKSPVTFCAGVSRPSKLRAARAARWLGPEIAGDKGKSRTPFRGFYDMGAIDVIPPSPQVLCMKNCMVTSANHILHDSGTSVGGP